MYVIHTYVTYNAAFINVTCSYTAAVLGIFMYVCMYIMYTIAFVQTNKCQSYVVASNRSRERYGMQTYRADCVHKL